MLKSPIIKKLILPFLIGIWAPSIAQYEISGTVLLNADWEPKIYLSAINSFEDLNAVSEDFIINMASIEADGTFQLTGNNIPEEPRMYRLHVCKKGDPIATIMIGGNEENHCHLVLNNNASILFNGKEELFKNYQIIGPPENNLWRTLLDLKQSWKKNSLIDTPTSRAYNRQSLENSLKNFADTTSSELIGLAALHFLDYKEEVNNDPNFYLKLLKKWEESGARAPYLTEYKNVLSPFLVSKTNTPIYKKWYFLILLLLIIALSLKRFFNNIGAPKKSIKYKQALLSAQERRVWQLLTNGMTNKEISNQLNIELSTVKSHVHNIYSKMGIKSRKEALKLMSED